MIGSHHQISAPTAIGLATTCSTAAVLATTPTGRKAVSTLGRFVYNQPSLLAGYTAGCLEGIRTQGLNVISYFIPSAKALAGREIAVEILGSTTGIAEIKAAGRISLGTLGWAAVTPVFQLVKTFMNACHRSIENGQQNQLIEIVRDNANVGALELAKRSLKREAEHYKALSERSVIPGWKSLLLTTAPTVLLAPELGMTALAAGAVAGAAQIAGNVWDKWANSSMYTVTDERIKSLDITQRAMQLKSKSDKLVMHL